MLRHGALALVVFFLAACGGSKETTPPTNSDVLPTPSAVYAATVPITATVTLDAGGSTAVLGRTLTYNWTLTSVPAGSAATFASPTTVKTTFVPDVPGTYGITLTVNDGFRSQSLPIAVTAVTFTPPTIVFDLVEPVSGTVQLSLSADPGTSTVTWYADGAPFATGATTPLDTTQGVNGTHVLVAHVQTVLNYSYDVTRTFTVSQSPVSFTSATISETLGVYTAAVGAQSVNGIVRVDASLDGVPLPSLAAVNTCSIDPTGAACAATGINTGYGFTGTVASGNHVLVVTAIDGIGKSLGTQLRFTVTDVP